MAEEKGGSGGSLADLMVVIQELARAGVSTPIVEASTAAYAVGAAPGASFNTIVVAPDADVLSNVTNLAQVPFADTATGLVVVTTSKVVTFPLAGGSATVEPGTTLQACPMEVYALTMLPSRTQRTDLPVPRSSTVWLWHDRPRCSVLPGGHTNSPAGM